MYVPLNFYRFYKFLAQNKSIKAQEVVMGDSDMKILSFKLIPRNFQYQKSIPSTLNYRIAPNFRDE